MLVPAIILDCMGRKTKQREEKERTRAQSVEFALRHRVEKPDFVTEFANFPQHLRERVTELHEHYVHRPESWVPRIKSKAEARRFIDLVEYVFFIRYQVPNHLTHAWTQPPTFRHELTRHRLLQPNFRLWYVVAARGGSLYKEVARGYLSKQELHHFLTAPTYITDPSEAYWYAIARAQSDDQRTALHVAMSRIHNRPILPIGESPWPDIARYFARNPTNCHEISDLSDYINNELEAGNAAPLEHPLAANRKAFSLKGRSLEALRRRTEEWHRALRKQQSIGGGNWPGVDIPDVDYQGGNKDKRSVWRFRQIKTGDALYKEGQRMHHCVAAYKSRCMRGDVSIWSLKYEFPIGVDHRGLTIEVTKTGAIVQCRGYANRLPLPNEAAMVQTWARDNNLAWTRR